jgi:DNA-binding response OmpR family regulator
MVENAIHHFLECWWGLLILYRSAIINQALKLSLPAGTLLKESYMGSEKSELTSRILVVDDNEDIRNLLEYLLTKEGYKVSVASDGDEGLQKAITLKPDLILLDVMMPNVSGLETLTALRANKDQKISSIPVIMITAKSGTDDVDEALARGADSYIVKPFRPASLISKVSTFLTQGETTS